MTPLAPVLASWLARRQAVALVAIAATRGSTPREAGAAMLVSATASAGTIGGGQLEFHAIDVARAMLAAGEDARELPLTLGPQMGQCCGGQVVLSLRRLGPGDVATLAAQDAAEAQARPSALVFGAGHTGRALAAQLALLPVRTVLVDDRAETLAGLDPRIEARHLADPEQAVADAPAGAAYAVMTHSHALDYRLAEAALRRGDAAHVGLIGSATKRARFLAALARGGRADGVSLDLAPFACPIGGAGVPDKRPEVIAALAAAEIVRALFADRRIIVDHPRQRPAPGHPGRSEAENRDPASSPSDKDKAGSRVSLRSPGMTGMGAEEPAKAATPVILQKARHDAA